jgi:hypothetical protein
MKRNLIYLVASALAGGALLSSCANEEPFGDGDGCLNMKMVLNHTITRSGEDVTDQSLADKATVYISGAKGLMYKYKGVENVPASLALKSGSYVAEAWTGDSVSASFDKKFYRGYQNFDIRSGETTNVVLNCKIANVVASVAPSADFSAVVKDYKVTVGHSYATLDFTPDNFDSHAYFMMPYKKEEKAFEPNLTYSITGTLADGTAFEKGGTIWNVERAHEYVININYTPGEMDPYGGALISVVIDDHELVVDDTVEINGAPVFSGVGFDMAEPLLTEPGAFSRCSVFVQSLGDFRTLSLHTDDYAALGLPSADIDFATAGQSVLNEWRTAGMSCEFGSGEEGIRTARIFLEDFMLNKLPEGVYNLRMTAVDSNAKKRERTLTLNVSASGIVLTESVWHEIYAHSATLHANIVNDDVTDPGFRYREAGTSEWIVVSGVKSNMRTRAAGDRISVTLTGLKAGTRYEYQAVSEGFVNENSLFFTTESEYDLPNASFEDWSQDTGTKKDNAWIPGAGGVVTFWDTGNHGSMTMSKNVTTRSTEVFHSGSASAMLQSQFVGFMGVGKFAAGNLFAGSYLETLGTNGHLSFGRAYNGSRPVKLRGYVYYTPGEVDRSEDDDKHPDVVKGSTDRGIIYVALTTQAVDVNTQTKELFEANASYVLAYGQMIFTGEYGSSSAMREFEITLEYKDAALLQRAGYLVITASASQYGDYFTGSTSSVMYLDDLELVY